MELGGSVLKCPKCSAEMETGFVLDKGHSANLPSQWVAGPRN